MVGAIAAAFGVNEAISTFTGENILKNWMGDDLYYGLYIGSTIVSTIFAVSGTIYLKNLTKQGKVAGNNQIVKMGKPVENNIADNLDTMVDGDILIKKIGNGEQRIYVSKHGDQYYIGRTKQTVKVRIKQHLKDPRVLTDVRALDGLNYQQVRGMEQLLIDYMRKSVTLSNKINGISNKNLLRDQYLEAGQELFKYFNWLKG